MAITKSEADGEHPASHYLVVEDSEHPSTWHLRVKDASGKPDHTLLGAAWAALHGGYRGNTYQGPGREEALRKLKALYASEGMETPKADGLQPMAVTVKAAGDWELDVLVPYGSPTDKDDAGEYFDSATNFHLDKYTPPAVYYHGFGANKRPEGQPVYLGRTIDSREEPGVGRWLRVKLDQAVAQARRLWEHVKGGGQLVSSSGSIGHLVRRAKDGRIIEWPLAEISIWEHDPARPQANTHAVAVPVLKMMYAQAGLSLPDDMAEPTAEPEGADAQSGNGTATQQQITKREHKTMDENIQAAVDAAVKAALEQKAKEEAAAKREADIAAMKAELDALKAKAAEAGRLPTVTGAPAELHFSRKYDNLTPAEHAFLIDVMDASYKSGSRLARNADVPEASYKALAAKMAAEASKDEAAHQGMKALFDRAPAFKADEINRSTLASYGDEWVGVQYSTELWEKIRTGSWVVAKIPQSEIPRGFESNIIPLESVDPTWYKVAQAADTTSGTSTQPALTVPVSRIGTASKTVTVGKMGCRVIYPGELEEDSLIAWVPNAMRQIQVSGSEMMEYVVIDGDTAASSNINDIGGTTYSGAASSLFLLTDGLRKLPLVTNTANSRDGGAIAAADIVATLMLMGRAGLGGADPTKVSFVCDPWTMTKLSQLPEVYTRDVYPRPTLENGIFLDLPIFNYSVRASWFMHYAGIAHGTVTTATYQNKVNSAGKVDQNTEGNNTLGALLAVRWDQWVLKWKRRLTIESTRQPSSDTTEIVAMARWGLGYRDNEAAAISYNLTVA